MPDHLIVIRSGPTDYDLQGRIRGTLDVPLAAAGIAAAEAAAALLVPQTPAALYVAADAAAREASRPMAGSRRALARKLVPYTSMKAW
jgi:broad specificity phosphatase PhoE